MEARASRTSTSQDVKLYAYGHNSYCKPDNGLQTSSNIVSLEHTPEASEETGLWSQSTTPSVRKCGLGIRDWRLRMKAAGRKDEERRRKGKEGGREPQNGPYKSHRSYTSYADGSECQVLNPGTGNLPPTHRQLTTDNFQEAPPGFEPGMADLQSAALAAWLRGRRRIPYGILPAASSPAAPRPALADYRVVMFHQPIARNRDSVKKNQSRPGRSSPILIAPQPAVTADVVAGWHVTAGFSRRRTPPTGLRPHAREENDPDCRIDAHQSGTEHRLDRPPVWGDFPLDARPAGKTGGGRRCPRIPSGCLGAYLSNRAEHGAGRSAAMPGRWFQTSWLGKSML